MKYKAVIFDCDGTLLDSLGDLTEAVNYAMRKCGFPPRTTKEVNTMVGNGIKPLIDRALPEYGRNRADDAFVFFKQYYETHFTIKTKPYYGITAALTELKSCGIKTACVSNKNETFLKPLCEKYFGNLLDAVVGENPRFSKKPAPDMVYEALRLLNVRNEDAVYVGDSEVDVATAKNSGLDGIFVLWGYRTKETLIKNGAAKFIDAPVDLVKTAIDG
jgi:phosphoglycolate phosphatase